MARRQLKAPRFSGLRFTLLIIALCCLLAVAAIGCGPSEQEIEATVAAGIQATATAVAVKSTATAVANLPTATPVVTSPTGLQLPSRVRGQPLPIEPMSLEEARKMYRDIGCMGCSTTLAEIRGINRDAVVEIIVDHFIGNDQLPDAVYLKYYWRYWGENVYFDFEGIPLWHNGVNLVELDTDSRLGLINVFRLGSRTTGRSLFLKHTIEVNQLFTVDYSVQH